MVGIAIVASFVLATASAFGARAPQRHLAAAALQAALVEARALALTTADATDSAVPTGATVTVAPDPLDAHASVITVYRSRPIVNAANGGATFPLVPDVGFPVQHVGATFSLNAAAFGAPFAVLLSSSGYASIADGYTYSPADVRLIAIDPGCNDAGVSIAVSNGGTTPERHPFVCREGTYEVSVFQ